jgi:benzodiazapine receptor
MRKKAVVLAAFVATPLIAGALGSLFMTPGAREWYAGLVKPPLTPPDWVFGPVWTVLYIMMGVAAFLVWLEKARGVDVKEPLVVFAIQLGLNALWTPAFFGLHSPPAGLFVMMVMVSAIAITASMFLRISRAAGLMMFLYLFWAVFALYLNLRLIIANPDACPL